MTATSDKVTQLVEIKFTHAGNTGTPVGEGFSLSAAYLNISGLWIASLEDKITASVADVYGNAVKNSTLISFKTYNTGGLFETDNVPDLRRLAASNLYSQAAPYLSRVLYRRLPRHRGPTTRVTASRPCHLLMII